MATNTSIRNVRAHAGRIIFAAVEALNVHSTEQFVRASISLEALSVDMSGRKEHGLGDTFIFMFKNVCLPSAFEHKAGFIICDSFVCVLCRVRIN
jgi:hypothetical protein